VKAICIQTGVFDAKYDYESVLYRWPSGRFGHTVVGTLLGTRDAFFPRSVQKAEGKRVTERSNAATEERLKSGHAVGGLSIV